MALGEPSGTTADDRAGIAGHDGRLGRDPRCAPAPLTGDANTAYSFNGTATAIAGHARPPIAGAEDFTVEAWFQTTSTTGGRILGFGSAATGNSSSYDRHVYLDAQRPGDLRRQRRERDQRTVDQRRPSFNDGTWHHVAASLSPPGMALYVDGKLVGSRTDTTAGQAYNGYFRVGGDRALGGASSFTGRIDEVALYPTALPADAGGRARRRRRQRSGAEPAADRRFTSAVDRPGRELRRHRLDATPTAPIASLRLGLR